MKRQLYYLLPDSLHTKEVCDELKKINIPEDNIHAVVNHKSKIDCVSDVHTLNEPDQDYLLESKLWKLNLSVFAVAAIVLIGMVAGLPSFYLVIPLAIMIITLIAGFYFVAKVPNVHWNEFVTAIRHGEILLIIDVPKKIMHDVDQTIHKHHPELINGGACWKV